MPSVLHYARLSNISVVPTGLGVEHEFSWSPRNWQRSHQPPPPFTQEYISSYFLPSYWCDRYKLYQKEIGDCRCGFACFKFLTMHSSSLSMHSSSFHAFIIIVFSLTKGVYHPNESRKLWIPCVVWLFSDESTGMKEVELLAWICMGNKMSTARNASHIFPCIKIFRS